MKVIFAAIGLPVWIFASALWAAFVFTKLWWWFVIPIFHVMPLSLALAYGLIVIVNFLKPPDTTKSERPLGESIGIAFSLSILAPAMALFIGWIAHFYV